MCVYIFIIAHLKTCFVALSVSLLIISLFFIFTFNVIQGGFLVAVHTPQETKLEVGGSIPSSYSQYAKCASH